MPTMEQAYREPRPDLKMPHKAYCGPGLRRCCAPALTARRPPVLAAPCSPGSSQGIWFRAGVSSRSVNAASADSFGPVRAARERRGSQPRQPGHEPQAVCCAAFFVEVSSSEHKRR